PSPWSTRTAPQARSIGQGRRRAGRPRPRAGRSATRPAPLGRNQPAVVDVAADGLLRERVLELVVALEVCSEHPLARAILPAIGGDTISGGRCVGGPRRWGGRPVQLNDRPVRPGRPGRLLRCSFGSKPGPPSCSSRTTAT